MSNRDDKKPTPPPPPEEGAIAPVRNRANGDGTSAEIYPPLDERNDRDDELATEKQRDVGSLAGRKPRTAAMAADPNMIDENAQYGDLDLAAWVQSEAMASKWSAKQSRGSEIDRDEQKLSSSADATAHTSNADTASRTEAGKHAYAYHTCATHRMGRLCEEKVRLATERMAGRMGEETGGGGDMSFGDDDRAAVHFNKADPSDAQEMSPGGSSGSTGTNPDYKLPRGAAVATLRVNPIVEDEEIEELPLASPHGTPALTTHVAAPEGRVGVVDPEDTRPGAYETAGRAPGRLPAWGRAVRNSVLLSLNRGRISTSGANEELPYTVPAAEAMAVNESELENAIREEILANAARASVVDPELDKQRSDAEIASHNRRKRKKRVLLGAFAVALVGAVIGLAVALSGRSDMAAGASRLGSNATELPTAGLEEIIKRGKVKCDAKPKSESASGRFYQDLCRAIAAAVFGNPNCTDFVDVSSVPFSDRFLLLANGTIDVMTRGITHTLERDVHHHTAQMGFSFSVPYLYEGSSFGGMIPYSRCADNLDVSGNVCKDLRVCVETGSTNSDILEHLLPADHLVKCDSVGEIFEKLADGTCNVLMGERRYVSRASMKEYMEGLEFDISSYSIGENVFSKEPLALATREDDPLWSDLVDWVLRALFTAEVQGITQSTAAAFPETLVFGDKLRNTMFRNVIAAVGNYGEVYERHLESVLPRDPVNKINTGHTGLIYSHPFGTLTNMGPGPVEGGTLELIQKRRRLVCGIVVDEKGTAFDRMDSDFCRAAAAGTTQSIQDGSVDFVAFVHARDGFEALANGKIDVLSGAGVGIEKDVHDQMLGVGFSFSQPYFYESHGQDLDGETRSLATRQDDHQWSDFVYWVVASTFFAEEQGITQSSSNQMPPMMLFGDKHSRLFRDVILSVGNYREIYARSLNATIPRSGRNRLQRNPYSPQHFPFPFS